MKLLCPCYNPTIPEGQMSLSAKAILSRFAGDVTAACTYCETVARTYGRLADEYRAYREEILNHV